jgi:hypothetical protein
VLDSGVVRCFGDGDGDISAPVTATTADFSSQTASLRNPPVSRVTIRVIVLYIGGTSLMSVVLMWPTLKISIFCVGCLHTAGSSDYWYQLY